MPCFISHARNQTGGCLFACDAPLHYDMEMVIFITQPQTLNPFLRYERYRRDLPFHEDFRTQSGKLAVNSKPLKDSSNFQ